MQTKRKVALIAMAMTMISCAESRYSYMIAGTEEISCVGDVKIEGDRISMEAEIEIPRRFWYPKSDGVITPCYTTPSGDCIEFPPIHITGEDKRTEGQQVISYSEGATVKYPKTELQVTVDPNAPAEMISGTTKTTISKPLEQNGTMSLKIGYVKEKERNVGVSSMHSQKVYIVTKEVPQVKE